MATPTPTTPPLTATCSAPVNIAVLKYWGKRDPALLLPINDSLSVTLHQEDLKTTTSAAASASFKTDRLWLNGVEESVASVRIQNVLKAIRARLTPLTVGDRVVPAAELQTWPIHVVSSNNFPTASGLASSASGYAALVYTLTQMFQLKEKYEGEFSAIARVGSGSACRSLYGGFVKWQMGEKADGSDSIAIQVAPASAWPLEVLVLVVSDLKKEVSSTSGMQTTVATSGLVEYRKTLIPTRLLEFEAAIASKDWKAFAELTMKDSNQFHAVCLDTYPPIFYMNDVSRKIVSVLTKYNALFDVPRAAYTFDAGPNAVIYCLPEHKAEITSVVNHYFPISSDESETTPIATEFSALGSVNVDAIERLIHTKAGPGPQVLSSEESLINAETGQPHVQRSE
eukprot:TRINITY_DN9089_c0_g1_i1.p1 TRINITY_DN9089_c0_g1~~TRINITY_DN9089_c0_g1_i1.p1  ORF type:complete len:398 (-),score=91.53 TRINITY_DN9089_c0_g1_i1:223-1416(-)